MANLLLDLLKSATTPFRQAYAIGAKGGDIVSRKLFKNLTEKERRQILEKEQSRFLDQQEKERIQSGLEQKPIQTIGKTAIGAASYGVPFGRGGNIVTKALLPGAITGGAQALSEDKNVVTGALSGLATAGALHGAGNLISKGKEAIIKGGESLLDKSSANFLKSSPAVFDKAQQAGININKSFQKFFSPNDDVNKIIGEIGSKKSGKLTSIIKDQEGIISKVLKNSGDDIIATSDDLLKPLNKIREKLIKVPGNAGKVQQLDQFINETGNLYKEGLNAKQLLDVKRIFDEQFGASVVDDATGAVIRDAQKSIANTSRSILKKTFKGIQNALDNESELLTMKPILERARATANTTALKQPGGLGLLDILLGLGGAATGNPLVGAGLIAGKKALQSPQALNIAGKATQLAGEKIPSTVNPILQNILQQGASRFGSDVANELLTGVPAENQQPSENQVQNDVTEQVTPPSEDIISQLTSQGVSPEIAQQFASRLPQQTSQSEQGGVEITPQMAAMAQLLLPSSEASKLAKAYQIQQAAKPSAQKKLSSAAAKDLSRNQTAKTDILEFKKLLEKDPSLVLKSAIPGSPGARQYRSLWGSIIDAIGTNRTGAAYTTDQRKDYAHLLPVVGDSETTIKEKLTRLEAEINNYASNLEGTNSEMDRLLQTLQSQGINLQ